MNPRTERMHVLIDVLEDCGPTSMMVLAMKLGVHWNTVHRSIADANEHLAPSGWQIIYVHRSDTHELTNDPVKLDRYAVTRARDLDSRTQSCTHLERAIKTAKSVIARMEPIGV